MNTQSDLIGAIVSVPRDGSDERIPGIVRAVALDQDEGYALLLQLTGDDEDTNGALVECGIPGVGDRDGRWFVRVEPPPAPPAPPPSTSAPVKIALVDLAVAAQRLAELVAGRLGGDLEKHADAVHAALNRAADALGVKAW